MTTQTDSQLLRTYAERRLEPAFAELVRRHVDFVYSAARRMVRDPHLAEDVTQGVFVALAKQAPELIERTTLAGWLHRTAQNIAAQTVRTIERRRAREQEAFAMSETISTSPDVSWEQIEPHLDAALGELNDADRDAVVLRYFHKKSAAEIAAILGVSDDAAQKRVSRAVERLREFFAKRGVTVGAGGLVVVISANAVQAAPVGLAVTISAAALAGTAATTSTLIAATTKTIAMTTLQKTLVTATVAVLAGACIYEARQAAQLRDQVQTLQQQQAPLEEQARQLQELLDGMTNKISAAFDQSSKKQRDNSELLQLRGKVGVLQRLVDDANIKGDLAEQKLSEVLSYKTQFAKHEDAAVYDMKVLDLAMRLHAADNGGKFTHDFMQLTNELGGAFEKLLLQSYKFDFINTGLRKLNPENGVVVGPSNMISAREQIARQAPDGTWRRIYLFSDGRVITATSIDGNFETWEKANTYSPPPNPDQ